MRYPSRRALGGKTGSHSGPFEPLPLLTGTKILSPKLVAGLSRRVSTRTQELDKDVTEFPHS